MLSDVTLRGLAALHTLSHRSRDERGQTLAEYGMVVAFIAVATVVAGVVLFRGAVTSMFHEAADCISRVTC